MSTEILLVVIALIFALFFFVTGKLRVDVTALIVLCFVAVTGLVTPQEAVSAFGNPAVVTIWAMFILSGALVKTNIANVIGSRVLKLSGKSETGLILGIMTISGLFSAFINNIGVAALMLPVVMSVSRFTNHSPSRLLIPMAFGVLLGGTTTIFTTMNILVSNSLQENGFKPFGIFDFTPVGIFVLTGGILFMAFVGRRFLPERDLVKETFETGKKLKDQYELQERMNSLKIPEGSYLAGKSISEINIGTVTGLTVVAIIRNGKTILAPDPSTILEASDIVVIEGRLDRLNEFIGWQKLQIYEGKHDIDDIISDEIKLAELTIPENSSLINKSYYDIHFRRNYGINVIAIKSGNALKLSSLTSHIVQPNDVLLVRGKEDKLNVLNELNEFSNFRRISAEEVKLNYDFHQQLYVVRIADDSTLIGKTLSKSRMGAVFGLHILSIIRDNQKIIMPGPDEIIQKDDKLVLSCREDDLNLLRGLQDLKIESESSVKDEDLESDQVGLIEVSLAPRSSVVGKTLRDIHFRTKYGLQVIAIWREGRAIRTNLRDIELKFGDALLLMGKRENVGLLEENNDFIVLSREPRQVLNKKKAPVSAGVMFLFIIVVLFNWLPISTAALSAVVLMILTGCLSIEDAYKSIDWKAIFLIAGMMPLGIAIQKTGSAELVASQILLMHSSIGNWGVLILLYIFITAAALFIPTSALVVFTAPVFISIAAQLNISPYTVMMVLAVSSAASFISPVSHPANVLVMGPGGYSFSDYTKVGLPLAIVVMIIGLVMISVFWPL
jgi:di/tricarboxylate transporter